jgi:hypothetical protein
VDIDFPGSVADVLSANSGLRYEGTVDAMEGTERC